MIANTNGFRRFSMATIAAMTAARETRDQERDFDAKRSDHASRLRIHARNPRQPTSWPPRTQLDECPQCPIGGVNMGRRWSRTEKSDMISSVTTHAGSSPTTAPADVLVIFGITGDLAKKMTFRSLYRLERRGLLDCPIIGVARRDWSHDELATHARTAIVDGGETIDETVFTRFAKRFSMVAGNYDDAKTYERLGKAIEASTPRCSTWRSRRRCSAPWSTSWRAPT